MNGGSAGAIGTMTTDRFPINTARIQCSKFFNKCELVNAFLDQNNKYLDVFDYQEYEIKTYSPERVTAIGEFPCATSTMSLDVKGQTATIVTVEHGKPPSCIDLRETPIIRRLVDGLQVAQKLNEDRVNKARALVYEPAKTLLPKLWPFEN